MYRPNPMTVRSTIVSTPRALSSLSRAIASLTRFSSSPHGSGKFCMISVDKMKTCSCIKVTPNRFDSIGPRTVFTSAISHTLLLIDYVSLLDHLIDFELDEYSRGRTANIRMIEFEAQYLIGRADYRTVVVLAREYEL